MNSNQSPKRKAYIPKGVSTREYSDYVARNMGYESRAHYDKVRCARIKKHVRSTDEPKTNSNMQARFENKMKKIDKEEETIGYNHEITIMREEQRERLEKLLRELDEKSLSRLKKHIYERMTFEEIANLEDTIHRQTIHQSVKKTLKTLRHRMHALDETTYIE